MVTALDQRQMRADAACGEHALAGKHRLTLAVDDAQAMHHPVLGDTARPRLVATGPGPILIQIAGGRCIGIQRRRVRGILPRGLAFNLGGAIGGCRTLSRFPQHVSCQGANAAESHHRTSFVKSRFHKRDRDTEGFPYVRTPFQEARDVF